MMTPAADLQKALFEALKSDSSLATLLGGAKIFDHAPANVLFPYVTFGRTSIYDWSTATETGAEQLITLHVWSKEKGKKESLDIMGVIEARLNGAPLALDDHHLIDLRFEFAEVRYDEDLSVYHGLLRFRAVTEKQ